MIASFFGWVTAKSDDSNVVEENYEVRSQQVVAAVEDSNPQKTNKKKKRKNKKKKGVVESVSETNNTLEVSLAADSGDSQDDANQDDEDIAVARSGTSVDAEDLAISSSLVDPVQIVVNEVQRKLHLKHPEKNITKEAVNVFVMEMWEKHEPYDNAEIVLEYWMKKHSDAKPKVVAESNPTHHHEKTIQHSEPVSIQTSSITNEKQIVADFETESVDSHYRHFSVSSEPLSDVEQQMVARLEQVSAHSVLDETLQALSAWVDLTNQAQGDGSEFAVNAAGDIFFKSRSLEMLFYSLLGCYGSQVFSDNLANFVMLLRKLLPIYAVEQHVRSPDALFIHLNSVFSFIASNPKAADVILHRAAENIRGNRRQATLSLNTSPSSDPITAALLQNEAITQHLYQSQNIVAHASEFSAATVYTFNQNVPVSRHAHNDLVNVLKKTLDIPTQGPPQISQVHAGQTEAELRGKQHELNSLLAKRDEAQRFLDELNATIAETQSKITSIQQSLIIEKSKVPALQEDGRCAQLADLIFEIEGKLRNLVSPICSVSTGTQNLNDSISATAASYLESTHSCFQMISNNFTVAKETESQLRGEIATYETLGLRQNVVAYTNHLSRVLSTMAQLEVTSRALQKELYTAILSGLVKNEPTKTQQILSFLASIPHLSIITELLPMIPKSSATVSSLSSVSNPSSLMGGSSIRRTPSSSSVNSPGRPARNNSSSSLNRVRTNSTHSRGSASGASSGSPQGLVVGSNGELKLNLNGANKSKSPSSLSLVANK